MPRGPRKARASPTAPLGADPFVRLRTDRQLDDLVRQAAESSRRPYAALLGRLAGVSARLTEREARAIWEDVVEHRAALARTLGRDVHLRVAALDLVLRGSLPRPLSPPALLPPRTVSRLLRQARTDDLTGLPTRRVFTDHLAFELRQRQRRGLVVAVHDVDDLKRINDQHGHAAGDEVLRAIAVVWRRETRQGDLLSRIGGDEFAALFVDCDRRGATGVLARVVEGVEQASAQRGRLTVSIGIAEAGPADDDPERLLARADREMYAAKRPRQRRPAPVSAPEPRPLVVCATRSPRSGAWLREATAARGWPLYPALDRATFLALVRNLRPHLVACDVAFPPGGGHEALGRVLEMAPGATLCLIGDAEAEADGRFPVIAVPGPRDGFERLLDSVSLSRFSPLPAPRGASLDSLAAGVAATIAARTGRGPGMPPAAATADRRRGWEELARLEALLGGGDGQVV
jgi:diguanylate cyclase (GGDEF)-like protein